MMLKLTHYNGLTKDNTPRTYTVYVNADHITAVYKEDESLYSTTVALSNGKYLLVMEDVDTVLLMMAANIRLTPEEWKKERSI